MTNKGTDVYRIFISSTAIDLIEHRKKVSDAILRLGDLPVAMETFGAVPNEPVEVCCQKAGSCDALVVMVAHRYGWVPTKAEGGDGHKNITWLETEAALDAGKPVFAFVVEPKHPWTQPKEQDLLLEATTNDAKDKVFQNVQALKDFRAFIDSLAGIVRETFTTPDNLAFKVATSLANWVLKKQTTPAQPTKRTWTFRVVHPLQPAPHFRGRGALLADLKTWWQDIAGPDRVRSLVAIGGVGKTAVIEQFLRSINKKKLRGSVLVWSFYEDPNTDAFLKEACIVFAGEAGEGAAGRLERLQRALTGSEPHLLILDGLERVQSPGERGRSRGELQDHQLKNFIRCIASGLGRTRALVTSRFKLTDLDPWEGAGHRTHKLDDLDTEAAVSVLKAWKVKGQNEQLNELAEKAGYHALSVSALGSYLHHFCDGDPDAADDLKLDEVGRDEPQAAKLGRILAGYATNLSDPERDLLIRLSVFPRGVSIEFLVYLIDAGGEIAGALVRADQAKLARLAQRLCKLGLVFTYELRGGITYTAHPFLRDYFRDLLGVPPEDIHEAVRSRLAPALDARPENKPTEPEILDRYEALIEHSILSGHIEEACDLYSNTMGGGGGDVHLFHALGDYGRMVRILSRFAVDGRPENLAPKITLHKRTSLINHWGLAAESLGDLTLAEQCFNISSELRREDSNWSGLAINLVCRGFLSLVCGEFPAAQNLLSESLDHGDSDDTFIKSTTLSYLASTYHALGEIAEAKLHFAESMEIYGEPLDSNSGIVKADHLMALGDLKTARQCTIANLAKCEQEGWRQDIALCHCILGLLSLPDEVTEAREHLKSVRDWTAKSGEMECILRAHILAAKIAHCAGDLSAALAEATTGLNLAEGSGFGRLAMDLLILIAQIQLDVPDYRAALTSAREALDRAEKDDCQYAWGQADALHLCGICHQKLNEHDLARRRLTAAVKVRKKIQHPGLEETKKLLATLKPPS